MSSEFSISGNMKKIERVLPWKLFPHSNSSTTRLSSTKKFVKLVKPVKLVSMDGNEIVLAISISTSKLCLLKTMRNASFNEYKSKIYNETVAKAFIE